MDSARADIWRLGGLDEKRAARFLSVTDRTFRTLWQQQGWPRKRIRGTTKVVYPKALIREFLEACEDAALSAPRGAAATNAKKKQSGAGART
ncbi:hypothetical protein R5W24_004471 [Gemmata sp. JC717]|uniref:hypothetical protein n=1 Tax=Gemmata algarum TaxID=2975278 RepID=UPI0021BB0BA9|nr:hypothetical protein [Gemmata algarum]MDY3555329.1 hypothetical protein [Gemmata algarum]